MRELFSFRWLVTRRRYRNIKKMQQKKINLLLDSFPIGTSSIVFKKVDEDITLRLEKDYKIWK